VLLCGGLLDGNAGSSGNADGVIGDEGGRRETSNRVARFLMLTSNGRSLEDWTIVSKSETAGSIKALTRVYIDGTCKLDSS
jgi:hypothetical protein